MSQIKADIAQAIYEMLRAFFYGCIIGFIIYGIRYIIWGY